jgi:hypothetical protein
VYSSPGSAVLFKAGELKEADGKAFCPESTISVIVYVIVWQQLGPSEHEKGGKTIWF